MISPRMVSNILGTSVLAGAAVLYRFPPQEYSFYPRCPFFALTHHYCPGCGTTRALAALLHGNVAQALHFNAAITLLAPLVLYYLLVFYWVAQRENRWASPSVPDWTWKPVLACLLLFGLLRIFQTPL